MLAHGLSQAVRRFSDMLDITGFFEQSEDYFQLRQRQLEDLPEINHRNASGLIAEDLDRAKDSLNLFDVWVFAGEKVVLHPRIAHSIDEDAVRVPTVAAGAPGFLRVRLERC